MQVAEVAKTNGGWTGTTVQESLSTRYRLVVATGRVCWDALADAIDALQWEEMRPAGTTWAKYGQGWSVRPATTAHGGAVVHLDVAGDDSSPEGASAATEVSGVSVAGVARVASVAADTSVASAASAASAATDSVASAPGAAMSVALRHQLLVMGYPEKEVDDHLMRTFVMPEPSSAFEVCLELCMAALAESGGQRPSRQRRRQPDAEERLAAGHDGVAAWNVKDAVVLQRLPGCNSQVLHRDAEAGFFYVLPFTPNYELRFAPEKHIVDPDEALAKINRQAWWPHEPDAVADRDVVTIVVPPGRLAIFYGSSPHAGGRGKQLNGDAWPNPTDTHDVEWWWRRLPEDDVRQRTVAYYVALRTELTEVGAVVDPWLDLFGSASEKEALVAEIKAWLATSREYKAIFQNFHSDVKMISQTYECEGMPGFVMPLGATPATMATYKGYEPGSDDYPFGDKLRRQARVGHGKLRDFTVAWLQRLLGAQNDVAAPSELAEWRAPTYMAKEGHAATKEYPAGDWMSDIGLHDSSKDMVLGLHAYVEDGARQAEREGGRNTYVVTSQTQHDEWAARAPFLMRANDVEMGDLEALNGMGFSLTPSGGLVELRGFDHEYKRESFGHGKVWEELVAGMSPTSPDSAKTQPYSATTDVDGID